MKHTARALITNSHGLCFLAIHNHYLPENIGKWGTIGGIMDATDDSIEACLARELTEEFTAGTFDVREKIHVLNKNGVTHHFFHVRTEAEKLASSQPEEVLETGFFTLAQMRALKSQGKLYFEIEDELYARLL